jgi:hypothetical protein
LTLCYNKGVEGIQTKCEKVEKMNIKLNENMETIENLRIGLDHFKEQVYKINIYSLSDKLVIYGNIKVLEFRASKTDYTYNLLYECQTLKDIIYADIYRSIK